AMSDRDRDPDTDLSDQALSDRLRHLDARLEQRRRDKPVAEQGQAPRSMAGMAQALRLASEFIAGVIVGAVLGWLLDWWVGTSPFGLIVFLLLGFGAGVRNILRAAGVTRQPDVPAGGQEQGPSDLSGRRD